MFTRLRQFLQRNFGSLKLDRSASSRAAILIFLLSFLSTVAIVHRLEKDRIKTERSRLSSVADDYAHNFQRNVEQTLSVTYALATLVHEYQGTIPNFQVVAKDLLSLYPGAYALALLPGGEITEIATLNNHDNRAIISDNQLRNLHQIQKIELTKNQEKSTFIVPFILNNNLAGSIGYLPIIFNQKDHQNKVWGFTTVTILFSEIFQDIYLERLEKQGLAYQIKQIDSQNKQQQIITTSSRYNINNINSPVEQIITVADTNWVLSLTPVVGWNQPLKVALKILLGISFSLILAALTKLFLDSKVYAFELDKIAYFDPLTSLPNRRLLLYRLAEIISYTQRNSKNVAVCYLDLDNFKSINDNFGSQAGDYLLVRIAKRLQKFLRVEDIIARVGDDEFVIVLQNLSHIEEIELILARIMEAVTTPIVFNAHKICVSTSIGVTIYPQDNPLNNHSVEILLDYAQQAMSYSKQHEDKYYTFFSELKDNTKKSPSTQT